MLVKNRKGVVALAAAMNLVAGVAQAENLIVTIVDGGYLPSITYTQPGDKIIFENWSDFPHIVGDPQGSWVSDQIPTDGGRYTLDITEETPMVFASLTEQDDAPAEEGESAETLFVGEFSYDEPPLAE